MNRRGGNSNSTLESRKQDEWGQSPKKEKSKMELRTAEKQPGVTTESPAPAQTSAPGGTGASVRGGEGHKNEDWSKLWEAAEHSGHLLHSLRRSDCPSHSPQEEADWVSGAGREPLSWGEAGTRDREYGKEEDNVQVSSRSLKPLAASS